MLDELRSRRLAVASVIAVVATMVAVIVVLVEYPVRQRLPTDADGRVYSLERVVISDAVTMGGLVKIGHISGT
jgi:hypothetical protein